MSDVVIFGNGDVFRNSLRDANPSEYLDSSHQTYQDNSILQQTQSTHMPSYLSLQEGLDEANGLVDDIVLKNYLNNLIDYEIKPLDERYKNINKIRMFKITEMVYQNNEYSTYKLASVFNSVQSLKCGIFIVIDSNGEKTDFYMGVRNFDDTRTTDSLNSTLRNALVGQFPGVKVKRLWDKDAEEVIHNINYQNIASVSCVAKNKDEDFNNNDNFIQGLEKLVVAMQGQSYTGVILAKNVPSEQLNEIRYAYESIYTQLSPFSNMQLSYGTSKALSVSDAFSHGKTIGTSHSTSMTTQKGTSHTKGTQNSYSESRTDSIGSIAKCLGNTALGIGSLITAPLTGGASLAAAGVVMAGQIGLNAFNPKSTHKGTSISNSYSENESTSKGESFSKNESLSETRTQTKGITTTSSDTVQLTLQNKSLINTLEKIDLQLKRIEECESIGMWECAAYFLSESQETAEMAAGTYKALMKGENSGVETSAINCWGYTQAKKLPLLYDYISNFIHPIFEYYSSSVSVPVTPASLVSSNELAIHMGLPRKSVCGFPVIEHADFAKEVVSYTKNINDNYITLGNIFTMGNESKTKVKLDCSSLTMHSFITGSTGSGKSNTIYEILNQLRTIYNIPFLVIEPAKGEYKNIFGQFPDVKIYGTNPKKSTLLKINPFRFPSDVHVLEHLDRLVELFNVCWPMYAAMPAILKEAMENAYTSVGWDIEASENFKGNIYPNFSDLLEQVEKVINESKYSADSKGDYSGALLTRIRSLTNGLNGLIFSNDDLDDIELFDRKVIVDLSRIGSTETKSLIMGLLVMRLNEYRMASGKINSSLSHITVLEEAHNLLKRTSLEQSSESANLLGKSVELLANSIAEMRTYGEGFIIADQSPGLLDLSVIRNTNTKIILRLPDKCDRESVGYAAGLKTEQIEELSKLKRGVAAVYQNDWIEPVLVQVAKCDIKEINYAFSPETNQINSISLKTQLIYFLIQGSVKEKLEFSLHEIEQNLNKLKLSSLNLSFIKEQILEFKTKGTLSIWNRNQFKYLSQKLVDIMSIRDKVENLVLIAKNNSELTCALKDIVTTQIPNASQELILILSQCMMRDMSLQEDEIEMRETIYRNWLDAIRKGGKGIV